MAADFLALEQDYNRRAQALHKAGGEPLAAFRNLVRAAGQDGVLSHKTKELIALAIAIATRCEGCIVFHARACLRLGVTRAEIVEMIGEIMGHRWEVVPVPRHLLPRVPQSQGLPYSGDPYDIEPHLLLDLCKIKSELGYRDRVPVDVALERTVRYLRDNPPAGAPPFDDAAWDEAIRRAKSI
mgnify:CR=1 FL=1